MKAEASVTARHNRYVLVTALGITQILAWGSSYYLPAVLTAPIAKDTGRSPASVAGRYRWCCSTRSNTRR